MQLARNWCLTWGEWAHDADPGGAKENAAETALRAALTTALAQQPAACPKCVGTGEADSGGIHPWGAPATIPCDCQQPAAVDGAMVERALSVLEQAAKGGSIINTELVWSGDVDRALATVRNALTTQPVAVDGAMVERATMELYREIGGR